MTPQNFAILLEELKQHEGYRSRPYKCSAGYWTVGYGRNLDTKGITHAEAEVLGIEADDLVASFRRIGCSRPTAEYLLENDAAEAVDACRKVFDWFDRLSDARQRVIANIVFNIGLIGFFKFKRCLAAIERGDHEEVGAELVDSLWYRQVKSRGKYLVGLWLEG